MTSRMILPRTNTARSRLARLVGIRAVLLGLVLAAFGLRVTFWQSNVYHTDEYITMLAARMVAQRGLPIFPSGMFYDHGLLYSLVSGGLIALVGFVEQIARWPALLAGVLALPVYYLAGRRLFGSSTAGLLAVALVAFDQLDLKWSVWARMYTFAHLFVLLSLTWLLVALLRPGRRSPYLVLLFLAGALFSHTLTFFILPPLIGLALVFTLAYRPDLLRNRRLWLAVAAALVIPLIVLAVVAQGQVDTIPALQDPNAAAPPPLGLEFLRGFFLFGLEWSRFARFVKFFLEPPYNWLLLPMAGSLLVSLYRLARRRATPADQACLFLSLFVVLVVVEMGALLTADWQKGIYMFLVTFPAFLLLAGQSLARLLFWLAAALARLAGNQLRLGWVRALPALAGLLLIGVVQGPAAWDSAHGQTTGDYNTAFKFVAEQWQPGDRVMTEHPSAAYVYLERNDFYANQVTAKVLDDEGGENPLVDRYTGSPLIDTVEKFNAALASGGRIWLVVGNDHLNKYYDSLFHQQIFAQMELVRQFGGNYVFASRPYRLPIPAEPGARLAANFGGFVSLGGYYLDPAAALPDGTTLLGLYWRPLGPPPTALPKVFVQLRNNQGQTIAQADHFIWQGLLAARRWERLQAEGEWLRDAAYLPLPAPLPPEGAPYRVYVGLYNPDTFERTPVLNDASGENAAVIELPALTPLTALSPAEQGQ